MRLHDEISLPIGIYKSIATDTGNKIIVGGKTNMFIFTLNVKNHKIVDSSEIDFELKF